MNGDKTPQDDELDDWHALVGDVKPLKQRPVAPTPRRTIDVQAIRDREHAEVLAEAMSATVEPEDWNTGDENEYRRNGISATVLRKLRRGQYALQGTLDLHGYKRQAAHQELSAFLAEAIARNWSCIKIVHGKGLRSPQGVPVLKSRVHISLQRNQHVLAFCSAPAWEGGHGAVLVLLRKPQAT